MTEYIGLKRTYKRLYEGQEFNNYKCLCEYLNQPIKVGARNKKYQIEEFNRYFEFDKIGTTHKIIITGVYEEPLSKKSKGMYSHLISKLIVDIIVKELNQDNEELLLSSSQLFKMLSMVNDRYQHYNNESNRPKLMEILNVSREDIDHFYSMINYKFHSMIESALKHLRDELFLLYNKTLVLCVSSDKHSRSWIEIANTKESNYVTTIRKEVLTELGYDSIRSLRYNKPDMIKYNNMVHCRLNDNLDSIKEYKSSPYTHIEYAYQAYHIKFIQCIEKKQIQIDQYITDNSTDVMKALNDMIVEKNIEGYNSRYESNKNQFDIYTHDILGHLHELEDWSSLATYNQIRLKSSDTYVTHGERLVNYAIKDSNNSDDVMPDEYKPNRVVLTDEQTRTHNRIDNALDILDR